MNWYKNLKIRSKLLITTVVTLILMSTLPIIAISGLRTVDKNSSESTASIVDKFSYAWDFDYYFQDSIIVLSGMSYYAENDMAAELKESKDAFATIRSDLKQALKDYISATENANYRSSGKEELLQTMRSVENTIHESYIPLCDTVVELIEKGKYDEANSYINQELTVYREDVATTTYDLYYEAVGFSDSNIDYNNNLIVKIMIIVSIVQVVALLLGVLFSLYNAALIAKPVNQLVYVANEVANGNFNVEINYNGKDEIGALSKDFDLVMNTVKQLTSELDRVIHCDEEGRLSEAIVNESMFKGEYLRVANGINVMTGNLYGVIDQLENSMEDYCTGNFDVTIPDLPGDKKSLTNVINKLTTTLQNVSTDIETMVSAAVHGQLDAKVDDSHFEGQWKVIISDLNQLMAAINVPISDAADSLAQFAEGNVDALMTNNYEGDYGKIKDSINKTLSNTSSYIHEIQEVLDKMATKNMDVHIDRTYVGDFQLIKDAINNISAQFNIILSDIRSNAEQITIGARNISDSSMNLAQGATEQASAVDNVLQNANQIARLSSDTAELAKQATGISEESKQTAETGNQEMAQMLSAMEDISKSSLDISQIIKVIEDIAFQTNLLALNAAVEAARAGEHGKGFTVVADQVRDLSLRSQEAVHQTSDLIEHSLIKVKEGSEIAQHTSESLHTIVSQVSEVSSIITEINRATETQSTMLQDINTSISQISDVTQQNTATSEMSAASAQELSSQSQLFNEMVSEFKLRS